MFTSIEKERTKRGGFRAPLFSRLDGLLYFLRYGAPLFVTVRWSSAIN